MIIVWLGLLIFLKYWTKKEISMLSVMNQLNRTIRAETQMQFPSFALAGLKNEYKIGGESRGIKHIWIKTQAQ